jgi:hypothetical protein
VVKSLSGQVVKWEIGRRNFVRRADVRAARRTVLR